MSGEVCIGKGLFEASYRLAISSETRCSLRGCFGRLRAKFGKEPQHGRPLTDVERFKNRLCNITNALRYFSDHHLALQGEPHLLGPFVDNAVSARDKASFSQGGLTRGR
jgi:hypothetical protein